MLLCKYMKNFFKKILLLIGIVTAVSATFSFISPSNTYARDFLGMPSWDDGLSLNDMDNEDKLTANIVKIASNILTDISVIASYLVVGYVIYGGYLYMFSSGDPGKAAAGKKTLTHAFIGLAITISAYTIFSAIRIAFIGNNSLGGCTVANECVTPETMVTNLIQWVAGIAGVVAAVFVVIGGWGYITSTGDPGKLQKAKTTILYALIGLAIVALTEVVTAFIASTVRSANEDTSFLNNHSITISINKETHEKI